MKNKFKVSKIPVLGIIAIIAVIGLLFTGCPEPDPQPVTYTVTFNADGGTPEPQDQPVKQGEKVTQPAAMTKSGFTFGGWYKESAKVNQWNFDSDTVTGGITLYAKWTANIYTVTFNADGGTPAPQGQTEAHGGKVTQPADMTKDGYYFDNWYKEPDFVNLWNFASDTVTDNIIIYAKWIEDDGTTYTVTFNTNGGAPTVQDQTVPQYRKAQQPEDVTKDGFFFAGWFKEEALINQWNFSSDTVTGGITLYAKWTANIYTVNFNANGGTPAVQTQTVPYSETVTEPDAMTKTGYTFGGWYKEPEFINLWDFASNTVTGGITLYAKWSPPQATEGLVFTLLSSGIAYSVSRGMADAANVLIPSSYNGLPVTEIAIEAFINYSNMTSVTIPDSVTSIGSSAFYDCVNLTEINFNATAMTDFTYNSNVFSSAGTNSTGITVNIGANVTRIPNRLFYDNLSSYPKIIAVNFAQGSECQSIGEGAFLDCKGLTSVTIPDSVTSIGERAFSSCSGLTNVTIGNSVTSIGESAFQYCSSLTSVKIGDSVTSIGENAFHYCTSLTSITIPDSVTSIGDYAFLYCSSLTSVKIGDNVTSIGEGAFYDCRGLTSVKIGDSVTSIGDNTFYQCTSLTSITIPDSVTSIGENAFRYCTSLTSITIPDSVTSIGGGVFSGCSSLTEINFNATNMTDLTSSMWYGTGTNSSWITVNIGANVTKIPAYLFSGCSSLTSITIPGSVTSIGNLAFYACTGLASVMIPNSVTTIGNFAFASCPLASVTIPNSVTSIGNSAFYNCSGLTSVTFETGSAISSEDFGNNVFPGYSNGLLTGGTDTLKTQYLLYGAGTYTRVYGQGNWSKSN